MSDFVNEAVIQKIIRSVGGTCLKLRTQYVEILDDLPEGWTISNTLNMIGLGAMSPGLKPKQRNAVYDAETAKQMFAKL